MKYPTTRLVFDRKKQATKQKKALVQVEILLAGKKKYVTTGVKLYADQWDRKAVVKNSHDAYMLCDRIMSVKNQIDGYINGLIKSEAPFTWEGMDSFLRGVEGRKLTFVEFVEKHMSERSDIRETTRGAHWKLCGALREFGLIVTFDDITQGNVMRFDDFLHGLRTKDGKLLKTASIYNYHKLLKSYINEAVRREYIGRNPYQALRFDRGEQGMKGYLTEEEVGRLANAVMPNASLERVRDMFLLQCWTGLAYADLAGFDRSKVEERNGHYVLSDGRHKTGKEYCVVLLPTAVAILEKYNWKLPVLSNQQYNLRLKVVALAAGIDKPLTTHYARRTAGMIFLNSGMSIEVVARILGHGDIKTTQSTYAKILDSTVEEAFEHLKGQKD